MISEQLHARLPKLTAEFQRKEPFRHVVIDGFLDERVAARLLADFPPFDPKRALNENGEIGNKAVFEKIRALGPSYAALDELIQTRTFLDLVSTLTGIPELLYDPHYFGGGTHDNRDGQSLDVHVDFNRHPLTHTHRRLNLIVYLNRDWDPAWGGNLELHRDPHGADDAITSVTPLFNRAVIFETTECSWHGFSRIDLPMPMKSLARRSIALYFYTKERPAEELAATHATIYVEPPLPERFAAAHTLTEADVHELKSLLHNRDRHIQRLYRDVQRVQAQLDSALAQIGLIRGSRIFRALSMVRRAFLKRQFLKRAFWR